MAYGTRFTEEELEQLAEDFERGGVETGSEEVIETDTSGGTATITIRLPRSMIAALKSAAENEGIGATVLARRWIMQRLASRKTAVPSVVATDELVEWLLSHARPVEPPGTRGISEAPPAKRPGRAGKGTTSRRSSRSGSP